VSSAGVLCAHAQALGPAAIGGKRYVYERRRPELGTLHRLVRENLQTLYAAIEQGFAAPLPAFVRREFEDYIDCGLLCRGFAVLACEACPERRLVAFACKGRAFCPSCLGRRMAQGAANLVDHVLPRAPLRQFVLTVPFELRARLAYDGALLGAVGRIFVDSVLGFYRERLRALQSVVGHGGAVTVVQRTSADLRLNPHYHAIVLDGVFAPGEPGEGGRAQVFHALPSLTTDEVADLLKLIRVRVLRHLERRGVIEAGDELLVLDDELATREPALALLASAAVGGLLPAGPELRQRPALALRGRPGVEITAPLCVAELGFSLHAKTTASADDTRGREALVKYVLRPPIAQERLERLGDELVRIHLRRPFRDGTVAIDLDPLSVLCRLAAAVPPPYFHTVRYAGVLSAASKLRALVVPPPPEPPVATADAPASASGAPTHVPLEPRKSKPATHRSGYRPWAELLKRSFAIDVQTCSRCGGRAKLIALVTKPASIERFLRHLGEPTEVPALSPARGPPFWKSRTLRHKTAATSPAQTELFDA
jgi:hypothetical protein